jgi:hypothetical protein
MLTPRRTLPFHSAAHEFDRERGETTILLIYPIREVLAMLAATSTGFARRSHRTWLSFLLWLVLSASGTVSGCADSRGGSEDAVSTKDADPTDAPGAGEGSAADPEIAREEAYAIALAAYNAGPTRISRLRRTAESRGIDTKLWFDEMEPIVAREVGSEPVMQVQNVIQYSIQLQLQQLREERLGVEEPGEEGW